MNAARRPTTGPKTFWQRMRRMLRYRLTIPMMRARHSPEHAARGSLVGLFWAFTPSVGIQMPMVLISWAIARRFPKWDFNLVLAIAWTWTTNAFTALPCYYVFYLTGQVMFGRWGRLSGFDSFRLMWSDIFTADQSFLDQMQALARVLILDWGVTMLVGSLPWAFLFGWLGYRYTLKFVRAYRHARHERMKKRHQRHHAA
jgi:uncharacterized protein (DUF2062 family)